MTTALLAAAVGAALGHVIWIGSGVLTPEPSLMFPYLANSAVAFAVTGLVLSPFVPPPGSPMLTQVGLALAFGASAASIIAAFTFGVGSTFVGLSEIAIHLRDNWVFIVAFVGVFTGPISAAGLLWVVILGWGRQAFLEYHRRDGALQG
ncbi:MAG: hypothetical protein M3395_06280 [Chloroflexota bacterium]|nr:hypothetical protein [Chloroflexota bacterium]